MKQYKIGLIIGRFQPFHNGHKYLIEKALEYCEEIIIGIGSSNINDEKNPYTFAERKKFLQKFINKEGIGYRVVGIVSIPDHPDDEKWLQLVLKKTGGFDVSLGDNDWVNGIFENAKIKVMKIGYHKRSILEGTKIRKLINEKGEWSDRVPEYLVKHIK